MVKKISVFILIIVLTMQFFGCSNTDTNLTDEEILQMIIDSVEIPEYTNTDIDLLDSYSVDDYVASASWRSTASSVIDSTGKVTIDVSDKDVVLILTLTYNGVTKTKNFNVKVLGNEDYLVLYVVMNTLVDIPISPIEENLSLPTEYVVEDKTISATWTSDDETILTSSGIIHMTDVEQTVNLKLRLDYNGVYMEKTFAITVGIDPETLPVNWWHEAPVYTGIIEDEESKPYTPSCFSGAIYRKVVSSRDYWLGIEAIITLPEFTPDPERVDSSTLSYFLDNASIYMGGNAYYESDVGLAWSIGYDSSNLSEISAQGIAYRPFWRYITTSHENIYQNANPRDYEYYYYPGDKIRMSIFSPKPGYLQMRIELLSETTNPKYVNKRSEYNLGTDFNHIFTTDYFPSAGMGVIKSEFKRVNAIDQVANEGKPTINTNSKVENAIWHEVYLYREIDGEIYKVPMIEDRTASMTCPLGVNQNGDFTDAFEITYDGVNRDLGGEVVTINPNNGTGKLYNLTAYIPKRDDELEEV